MNTCSAKGRRQEWGGRGGSESCAYLTASASPPGALRQMAQKRRLASCGGGSAHVLLSLAQGLLEKECDLGYHCLEQSLAGSHPRRT